MPLPSRANVFIYSIYSYNIKIFGYGRLLNHSVCSPLHIFGVNTIQGLQLTESLDIVSSMYVSVYLSGSKVVFAATDIARWYRVSIINQLYVEQRSLQLITYSGNK